MTAPDSAIEAAARLVATNPGAADQLAARHQRRPDGRCQGCTTRLTWWPCAMATIAARATEIHASRHTGR
jgi:hypothetical protein